MFVNRRKIMMKVLYSEPSGYCLWSKRLKQGQFPVRSSASGRRWLNGSDLQLILDGIEMQKSRKLKHYEHNS